VARYRRGERERGWREVIRDQASIGLSISAFCRDRKLSPASFFNWRRKLAERESASVATVDARTDDGATDRSSFDCHGSLNDADIASKFVALDLPLSPATELSTDLPDASRLKSAKTLRISQPAAGQTGSRIGCEVVLPDGCRVLVPTECDAGWLREILAVVRDSSESERSC
jgi:hypothetical protein